MKLDKIIMNPPYSRNLHLKILSHLISEYPEAEVVNLSPIRWLQDPLAEYKKNSDWKRFPHIVEKIESIDVVSAADSEKIFGAAMPQDLGIYQIGKGGYKVKRNPIFEKMLKKVLEGDNLKNHFVIDDLDGVSCRLSEANENAGAHGADKMKAALVLPKDRAFYTNKKNDKTGQTYWEVSQKTAWGAVKPKHEIGNIKFTTKEERENFYNCMWTPLMRWYWRTQVVDLRNFLQFYPYLDFSHPWNDQQLYDYFCLTEEEIREIEKCI